MEWFVIAAIIAIIIVSIGVYYAIRRLRSKKDDSKAPFKKTYATTAKATRSEKDSSRKDSDSAAQPQISSAKATEVTSQVPPNKPGTIAPPSDLPPSISPNRDSFSAEPLKSAVAASQMEQMPLKSAESATVSAQLSKTDGESEPKSAETIAEVTEVDIEPIHDEEEEKALKDSPQFITEIESDPPSVKGKTPLPVEKSSPVSPPPQPVQTVMKKQENKAQAMEPKASTAKPPSKAEAEKAAPPTAQSIPSTAKAPNIDQPSPVITEEMPATVKTDAEIIEVAGDPHSKTAPQTTESGPAERVTEILNNGKLQDWVSLAKGALSQDHFRAVFYKIVKTTYPKRKDSKMRTIFRTHAQRYVEDVEPSTPPDSASEYIFKCLAIVMQEDKEYAKAIALCQKALKLGLDDGTKTGYPGRIERLKKNAKIP